MDKKLFFIEYRGELYAAAVSEIMDHAGSGEIILSDELYDETSHTNQVNLIVVQDEGIDVFRGFYTYNGDVISDVFDTGGEYDPRIVAQFSCLSLACVPCTDPEYARWLERLGL